MREHAVPATSATKNVMIWLLPHVTLAVEPPDLPLPMVLSLVYVNVSVWVVPGWRGRDGVSVLAR